MIGSTQSPALHYVEDTVLEDLLMVRRYWIGCATLVSLVLAPLVSADSNAKPFHRTRPFIIGADVSWVQEDEANGTTYYDNSRREDIFQILRDHGFNYIRLRVFVDPAARDGYAAHSKEAYCDLAHTLVMAKRAHDAGLGLYIDFHYSDTWATPGKQFTPLAWRNFSLSELRKKVYDYTYQVLSALKQQGTTPGMAAIGNEISGGMLFPDGSMKDHLPQSAELLKSGIAAARAVDPAIKVVLHHGNGHNVEAVRRWVDELTSQGVRWDIIGVSCNDPYDPSYWKTTFDDLATQYPQFGLIAAEYSYHKRAINDIVFNAPARRGVGTFIWEPTRHHEAIFDTAGRNAGGTAAIPSPEAARHQNVATTAPAADGSQAEAKHHPQSGRFDTNNLINLYPQMAKDYGNR
jgi:arabinogalactan endo-1,4-beta-galactosidase